MEGRPALIHPSDMFIYTEKTTDERRESGGKTVLLKHNYHNLEV